MKGDKEMQPSVNMTVDFLLSPIEVLVVTLLISVGLTGFTLSVRGGKSRKNHGMEVSLIWGYRRYRSKATLYEVKALCPLCVGCMQCGVKPLFSIREDSFSLTFYMRFSRSLLFRKIHVRSNETLSKHKVKGIYLLCY